jgi:hypothetical protein
MHAVGNRMLSQQQQPLLRQQQQLLLQRNMQFLIPGCIMTAQLQTNMSWCSSIMSVRLA